MESTSLTSPAKAVRLRTEYFDCPLGLDERKPRFFWRMQDTRAGAKQTSYCLRVASTLQRLTDDAPDLWDSGKVVSDSCSHIEYAGRPLGSRLRAWWDVQLWDAAGAPGEISSPTWFEMGLLQPDDWQARWIGTPLHGTGRHMPPVPLLRRRFQITHDVNQIRTARLYITARGLYDCRINGTRISTDYFRPGYTDYHHRIQYQSYDVTDCLVSGDNWIGVLLADGWYCGHVSHLDRGMLYGEKPSLLAQLEVTLADGTVHVVGTDDQWRWRQSGTLEADLVMGESYDARREPSGWDSDDSADGQWSPVQFADTPNAAMVASPAPPVRATGELPPVADPVVIYGSSGRTTYLFDFGQNISGVARLNIRGRKGVTIRLRYAEMLEPPVLFQSGMQPHTDNLRLARATDYYTLRGDSQDETWSPRFTYHGFRYVELSYGYAAMDGSDRPEMGAITRQTLTALVLHSDTPVTGTFECSNDLLNKLQSNITWSQRDNFVEIPTDCPQRDERMGWTGDAQVFVHTACHNMDVAGFFSKWARDMDDAQAADGRVPIVAPGLGDQGDAGPGWSDARVLVPWAIYQHYADRRILRRHYEPMRRWLLWQHNTSRQGVRCYEGCSNFRGFGDWLALDAGEEQSFGATPLDLIGTANFARSSGVMAEIAGILGENEDARQFAGLRAQAVAAFNREFVTEGGSLRADTQTAHAMALAFDLLPDHFRAGVIARLVELLRQRQWHLATGFQGTALLLPVLTRFGHADVAYRILMQTDYPGWLYAVLQGATTVWERWNGWTPEKGFWNFYKTMNSFNHYSFGAVGRWMYDSIGGITVDARRRGYRHVLVSPKPGGGITHASCAYDAISGRVETHWRIVNGVCLLRVILSANMSATVCLPDGHQYEVEAGTHSFESTLALES